MKNKPSIELPEINMKRAIGWWQDQDDDVGVRFHFSMNEDKTHLCVRAFNSLDGEEMIVDELRFVDGWLEMQTTCVSTEYSAGHRWKFLSRRSAIHELILREIWIKCSQRKYDHLLRRRTNRSVWKSSGFYGRPNAF